MMMKTLLAQVAPFLSLFITAQNSRPVYVFSGAAPQGAKCLDVRDPTLINGTVAQIWDCNGDVTEQWETRKTEVKIAHSNMCLDAGTIDSPNKVVIFQCDKSQQQQWIFTESNQIALLNNLDLCLDLPNGSTENEGQVETCPCNSAHSQLWFPHEI